LGKKDTNMAQFHDRYPLNISGKYYIDGRCTDCDLCREIAPQNIKRDDRTGISYIFKQPDNNEERKLLEECVEGCPTEGVGNDGDKFDWSKEPIFNWNSLYKKEGFEFEIHNPILEPFKKKQTV
jgi:ferredoxin